MARTKKVVNKNLIAGLTIAGIFLSVAAVFVLVRVVTARDPEVWARSAREYAAKGEFERAAQLFRRAFEASRDPQAPSERDVKYLLEVSEAVYRNGDAFGALGFLRQAHAVRPDRVDVLKSIVDRLWELQRFGFTFTAECKEYGEKLAAAAPGDPDGHAILALALDRSVNEDPANAQRAEEALGKARAADPLNPRVALSDLLMRSRKTRAELEQVSDPDKREEIVAAFREQIFKICDPVLEKHPSSVFLVGIYVSELQMLGQHERGERVLERALQGAPQDPDLLHSRAVLHLDIAGRAKADSPERAAAIAKGRESAQQAQQVERGIMDIYRVLANLRLLEAAPGVAGQPAYDEAIELIRTGFKNAITLKSARASIDKQRGEHQALLLRGFAIASQYPGAETSEEMHKKRIAAMKVFAEEAETRFRTSATTHYMEGIIAVAERDWTTATNAMSRANEGKEALSLAALFGRLPSENLALLYRELKQPGASMEWTDRAIKQYRDDLRRNPPLLMFINRAELLVQLDRAQEAIDQLETIRSLYGADANIDRVQAAALQKLGRGDEAMRVLTAAQGDQTNVDILIDQARIASQNEDNATAEQKLRTAFEMAPENEDVLTRLFRLLALQNREGDAREFIAAARQKTKQPILLKLYDSWEISLTEKDPVARLARFKELLEKEPDAFRRATDLYNLFQSQGDLVTAKAYLDEAEKLSPDDAQILTFQFGLALKAKDRERANQYLTKLANLNADRANGSTFRGALAATFGDYATALREFEDADRKLPDTSSTKLKLAQVHVGLGQFDRAAEYLKTAIRINPQDGEVRKLAFLVLKQLGDSAGASANLEAALKLRPNDPDLVAQKDFLLDEQEPLKAIGRRAELAKKEPENVENLTRLGQLYGRARKMALDIRSDARAEEATKLGDQALQKAFALAPNDIQLVNVAREFYVQAGQPDKAAEMIQKFGAAQTTPQGKISAELLLAQLYEASRRVDEAGAAFDRAEQLVRSQVPDEQQQRAGLVRLGFQRLAFAARTGHEEQAQEIAKAVLKLLDPTKEEERPFVADARRQIARSLLAQRKPVEAQPVLDALLTEAQSDVKSLMLRAEMWLQRGNTAKAIDDLSAVLTVAPNDLIVRYTRGDLYGRIQQFATAQEDLQKVKAAAVERPDDAEAQSYALQATSRLVSLYEIQDKPELAENELRQMLDTYAEKPGTEAARQRTADRLIAIMRRVGKLEKAKQICAEYMAKFPRNSDWPYKLGQLLVESEQYVAAADRFQDAMKVAEKDNLETYSLAFAARLRALQKADRGKDAQYIYENRPIKDVRPLVTLAAAEIYLAMGSGDQATEMRRKAILDAVRRSGLALQRVVLDLETRLSVDEFHQVWEEAIPKLSDPVEIARVRFIQAKNLAVAKRLEQALPLLDPGIALSDRNAPEHNDALVLKAQILDQLNRTDEAVKAYEQLLAEHPGEISALNNLAYLLATKGKQPKAALQYSQQAINLAKSSAPLALMDTHAWILHLNQLSEEAEGRLREALAIDPLYSPSVEHMARLLEETNRPQDAKKFYEVLRGIAEREKDQNLLDVANKALERLQ